ncbi:MAG: hypothetical protein J5858_17270 [Lentisphaeria bacterium]|nr:hypothetical protein [Lentisphaeria bacterium]
MMNDLKKEALILYYLKPCFNYAVCDDIGIDFVPESHRNARFPTRPEQVGQRGDTGFNCIDFREWELLLRSVKNDIWKIKTGW